MASSGVRDPPEVLGTSRTLDSRVLGAVHPRNRRFGFPRCSAPVILTEQSYDKLGTSEATEGYEERTRRRSTRRGRRVDGGRGNERLGSGTHRWDAIVVHVWSLNGRATRRPRSYVNTVAYNFAGYLALWRARSVLRRNGPRTAAYATPHASRSPQRRDASACTDCAELTHRA